MAWIAAAIGAASTAVAMIPSEAENENNRSIKELEERKKKGQLGLTDEEQAAYWNDTYGKAQRTIDEQRMRGDATMAATGNTSGGAMQAQQASQMNASALAASAAAEEMKKLDVEKHDVEAQELVDRLAVQKNASDQRLLQFSIGMGQAGETFGEYEGTTGESVFDKNKPSMMDGWSDDDYSALSDEQKEAAHTIEALEADGQYEEAQALRDEFGLNSPDDAAAWGTDNATDTGAAAATTATTETGSATTEAAPSAAVEG